MQNTPSFRYILYKGLSWIENQSLLTALIQPEPDVAQYIFYNIHVVNITNSKCVTVRLINLSCIKYMYTPFLF